MQGIIIGAGIGGLCAAIALRRLGIDIRAYEAAPAIHPVGAGIMMAPNAMWVFARLGIADAVSARGVSFGTMSLADQDGRVLQVMDTGMIERRFDYPMTAIHRADLHAILLDRLPTGTVALGKRCVAGEQTAAHASAIFEDGSEVRGDFLIGADGLHSVVRRTLFPSARVRFAGQTCWRGVLTTDLADARASSERWGRGVRMGFLPIGGGRVYWFATANDAAGGVDNHDPRPRLLELFGDFAEPVPSLLEHTPVDAIVRHDLYDLLPLSTWSTGRLTLLGDAAHATTPNLGQGGAQAVEDAWVLTDEMANAGDPAQAFTRYERRRRRKANRIARESRRFGWIAGLDSQVLCALRNLLVRWTPTRAQRGRFAWMFRAPG